MDNHGYLWILNGYVFMDISNGYRCGYHMNMCGYIMDILCGYLLLDKSKKISKLPKDIQVISINILIYPSIFTDIH